MRRLIHDLNNQLSVVTLNAGVLDDTDETNTREIGGEIAEAASHAASLTTQLMRCLGELAALPEER